MFRPREVKVHPIPVSEFRWNIGASLGKLLAAFGAVVSLSIATPALAVPTISFTELLTAEGAPPAFSVTTGVDVRSSTSGSETFSFLGTLHIPFGQGVLFTPPYSFVLLEPGGGVSDIVTVTTPGGFGNPGPVDFLQDIFVTFTSVDFLSLPLLPTCTLLETGLVQTCHLFSQAGFNILDIQIQSAVIETPEPASLALLGLGLAGLGFSMRKKA